MDPNVLCGHLVKPLGRKLFALLYFLLLCLCTVGIGLLTFSLYVIDGPRFVIVAVPGYLFLYYFRVQGTVN